MKKAAGLSLRLAEGRIEIALDDRKKVLAYYSCDAAEAKQIVKNLNELIRLSEWGRKDSNLLPSAS